MATLEDLELWKQSGGAEEDLTEDIKRSTTEDIINRARLIENEIKVPFPSLPSDFFFLKFFIV